MKTFTIENETNNIILHATVKDAASVPDAEQFGTEAALGELAAGWPAARLVEIYNTLPNVASVKKFTDRRTAVKRIWKALQAFAENAPVLEGSELEPEMAMTTEAPLNQASLPDQAIAAAQCDEPVDAQTSDTATEVAPVEEKATRRKKAPKAATNAGLPREGSKTGQVIAMLKREGGATLEEIMAAMQWQKHTTRAMLSAGGSLTKNHGLVIISEKVGDRRTYAIKP